MRVRLRVGWFVLIGVLQFACGAVSTGGMDSSVHVLCEGVDAGLPASNVYLSCDPSPDAGPGCTGDPGMGLVLDAGTRVFPPGCRVTFPVLNPWYCVPMFCECGSGAASRWGCPI